MNSIAASSIIFASVFAAALVGMAIRRALPEDHVGSDAKEVIGLATGLIGTMAALVLGMLVSARENYAASRLPSRWEPVVSSPMASLPCRSPSRRQVLSQPPASFQAVPGLR
jgi:hypothetical protein